MKNVFIYTFRLLVFILAQQFIGYRIPLLQESFGVVFYYLYVLWLPFTISRSGLLLLSFITGLALDSFTKTPGMHAAACTLIGYVRPFLITLLIPQREADFNYREPSVTSLGLVPYMTYVSVLTVIHHSCLFTIQAFQFGNGWYLFIKVLGSALVSLLLIALIEMIYSRKQKFLTNT
jgi:hypothetical protein